MNNDEKTNGRKFFQVKNAEELVNVAKPGRNRISSERELLLETFDALKDTQFFEYPCEGEKSPEKTKTAIKNFLKAQEKSARVLLAADPKERYIIIQKVTA